MLKEHDVSSPVVGNSQEVASTAQSARNRKIKLRHRLARKAKRGLIPLKGRLAQPAALAVKDRWAAGQTGVGQVALQADLTAVSATCDLGMAGVAPKADLMCLQGSVDLCGRGVMLDVCC